MAGEQRRIDRRLRPHLGNGADPHARHQRHLDDDVGAHLPGAGQADGDRALGFSALQKFRCKLRMGHIASSSHDAPQRQIIILNIPISI